ncbi:hypothetical protein ACJMK2_025667, partial [Sinanodonta woodiana]
SLYSAKQGCPGDNILLFQNIPVDREQALLKLYVNGIGDTVVGVWSIQNCVHNTTFYNGYEDRISLDEHGNIWIRNLQEKDEGNYTIEVLTKQLKHKVELNVFVAPETRCKPKIINTEDTMRTYLDQDGCGKPAATAYWLEQPGISIEILNLPGCFPLNSIPTLMVLLPYSDLKVGYLIFPVKVEWNDESPESGVGSDATKTS